MNTVSGPTSQEIKLLKCQPHSLDVEGVVEAHGDDLALPTDNGSKVELGAGQLHAGTDDLTRQPNGIGGATNQLERAQKATYLWRHGYVIEHSALLYSLVPRLPPPPPPHAPKKIRE